MKQLLLALAMSLAAAQAHAITVLDATVDSKGENIVVKVRHGGGMARDHKYKLVMSGGCAESMPVQCSAKIVLVTRDPAEGLLTKNAVISLKDSGLTGEYYDRASLTIVGSDGSEATVTLPSAKKRNRSDGGSSGGKGKSGFECVTHTGSLLTIDMKNETVTLVNTAGETAEMAIIDTQYMVLESLPVDAYTFSMDDGRKVYVSFRGESRTGSGHFVRVGGENSPEFKSCTR